MKIPGFGNGYAVAWSLEPWKINIKKKKNTFFFDWELAFHFGSLSKNNSLSQTWGPSASSEAL